MKTKKIALAAVAGTALLAASGAYADHRRDFGPESRFDRHHHRHHHRPAPRIVYRVPPPYYYAPPVAYYPPAPVYYAPPRPQVVLSGPVLYGTLPIGDARVRFGLQF